MSKKHKTNKKNTEEIRRELFRILSVETEEEFYDIIYSESEDVYERDLGFDTAEAAYDHFISDGADPAIGLVKKYKDKYITWKYGECVDGNIFDCDIEDAKVFDNFEDAKEEVDNMPYGEKPIEQLIAEIKESINDDYVDINVEPDLYQNLYNVEYKGNLLIEKCRSLDPEDIKKQIDRYKEFEQKCNEGQIIIEGIYKKPREWNDNQRYYRFKFFAGGKFWKFDAHIPSKMQHKKRYILDFLNGKWLEEMTKETKKFMEQGGSICPICNQGMLKADGCTQKTVIINNIEYNREKVKEEDTNDAGRCFDCGAKAGHFHHIGCDMEPCPKCGSQMISCKCKNASLADFWSKTGFGIYF